MRQNGGYGNGGGVPMDLNTNVTIGGVLCLAVAAGFILHTGYSLGTSMSAKLLRQHEKDVKKFKKEQEKERKEELKQKKKESKWIDRVVKGY